MNNIPEPVCVQLWSLQGLSPERKAQYDAILATPLEHFNGGQLTEPLRTVEEIKTMLRENLAPIMPRETPEKISREIEPWKSQLETIEYLKEVAARLRQFCDSPLRTAKVRSILKDAKVIGNVPRNYGKHTTKSIKKALKKKRKMRSDGLN